MNKRRFKKGLRKLEADLGESLRLFGFDLSNKEFVGRLDFWISYYVTWLLRGTDHPDDLWCDGSKWEDGRHLLDFKQLDSNHFSIKCNLDIQDDKSSFNGYLEGEIEFNPDFSKFSHFRMMLEVLGKKHAFSSTK